VLIANWNYDNNLDIAQFLYSKFSTRIKNENLPINLYKCAVTIDSSNIDQYKKDYDLIIFGDYYQSLSNCSASKICYSYILNSHVNNNYLRNKEDFHLTEITDVNTTLDIITGTGAQEYEYIINWISGLAFMESSQSKLASKYFLKAKSNSNNSDINLMLAISESKARNFDKSEKYFKESFKLKPSNCDTKVHYAVYQNRKGNIENAMSRFEDAINSNCTFSDYMKITNYAYPLTNLRRFEESNKVLHEIDFDNLDNYDKVDWLIGLGKNQIALGQIQESINTHIEAINILPDYYISHLELGKILGNMGENDRSLNHLKRAKRLQSNNPLTRYHLAKQYYIMRDNRKALKEYLELDKMMKNFDFEVYSYPSFRTIVRENIIKIRGYY